MNKIKISSHFDPKADLVFSNGDCLALLEHIPDGSVDLVLTSPPYNLGKPYEKKLELKTYIKEQSKVIKQCARTLSDRGSICWQVGNFVDNGRIVPLDIVLYPIFEKLGFSLRNRIVWHFGHGLHASHRFSGRYEVILWFTKTDRYIFNLDPVRVPQKYPNKKHFKGPKKGEPSGNPLGKNPSDIWEIPNVKANHVEKTGHPCQFPVELAERLVLSLTDEGARVMDPFMGTGSTAIAALIHNRKAAGAEIKKEYYDLAQKRVAQVQDGTLRIRPMARQVYDPNVRQKMLPPVEVVFDTKSKSGKITPQPDDSKPE